MLPIAKLSKRSGMMTGQGSDNLSRRTSVGIVANSLKQTTSSMARSVPNCPMERSHMSWICMTVKKGRGCCMSTCLKNSILEPQKHPVTQAQNGRSRRHSELEDGYSSRK